MTSFVWSFPQFIVDPFNAGLPNVVIAINWVCTGTDGVNTASASGTVPLPTPSPAQFIPYADITQEMAYQWVSQGINMSSVETGIAKQIAALSQPIIQPQNPPF
jgi:hypothetical protein